MKKDLLKNPEWNVGLYLQLMIYLQLILYDGDGRKTPKYIKNEYEYKGKNSQFGCPPAPRLRNGG